MNGRLADQISRETSLAERRISAALANRRAAFELELTNGDAAANKAGVFNGSAHREIQRRHCATELHELSCMFVSTRIAADRDLSGAASPDALSAAKTWIASGIAREAQLLASKLPQPRVAFNETWQPDTLNDAARFECESAYAELDSEWLRLQRSRIERGTRWIVRALRIAGRIPRLA